MEATAQLVDIDLGREFWVSHYLSMRPRVGVRIARIEQDLSIVHRGGVLSFTILGEIPRFNNYVDLDSIFKGAGPLAGLDTIWNVSCGFALYGNLAASIIYGHFSVDHDEWNREADNNHAKTKILETKDHFTSSRAILDLALGIQWSSLFCDCKYGFTAKLGWEQHLFFHQNQFWRTLRTDQEDTSGNLNPLPNNTGENTFYQRRGTLDTQGLALTFEFSF